MSARIASRTEHKFSFQENKDDLQRDKSSTEAADNEIKTCPEFENPALNSEFQNHALNTEFVAAAGMLKIK